MLKLSKIFAVVLVVVPFSVLSAEESDTSNTKKVEEVIQSAAESKKVENESIEKIQEELREELQNEITAPDCMVVPFCNG
jgi:transcriptional regulator NrdR family protein